MSMSLSEFSITNFYLHMAFSNDNEIYFLAKRENKSKILKCYYLMKNNNPEIIYEFFDLDFQYDF